MAILLHILFDLSIVFREKYKKEVYDLFIPAAADALFCTIIHFSIKIEASASPMWSTCYYSH